MSILLLTTATIVSICISVGTTAYEDCRVERSKCEVGDYLCNCPTSKNVVPQLYDLNIDRQCLPKAFVCQGGKCSGRSVSDCECSSEQLQCGCAPRAHKCLGGVGCYFRMQICNGVYDCLDGTDEVNCTCPRAKFQCSCYKNNSCRGLMGCLPSRKVCDGRDDCKDGSDERNCDISKLGVTNGSCVDQGIRCTGRVDCLSGSDEGNCTDMSRCQTDISDNFRCNGLNDCGDWSDEINCTCPPDAFHCKCKNQECAFFRGCLPARMKCDGWENCFDETDEQNCPNKSCRFNLRQCDDSRGCFAPSQRCDGVIDCRDKSDEINCTCREDQVMCGCIYGGEACPSSGRCIPKHWVGNGVHDCDDGSDEPCFLLGERFTFSCNLHVFKCNSKTAVERLLTHQSTVAARCMRQRSPCPGRIDMVCNESHWRCVVRMCRGVKEESTALYSDNGRVHVALLAFCSVVTLSNFETNAKPGFKCRGKWITFPCLLSQPNLYDTEAQCADKSDLCFVNGEFRCFMCLDRKLVIGRHQVCDGVVDCYDLSDECLCQDQSVCHAVLGDSQSTCPPGQMHCYNDTDCVDVEAVLCNHNIRCLYEKNTKFCYPQTNYTWCKPFQTSSSAIMAAVCDGRPECVGAMDECDKCSNPPAFCNNTKFMKVATIAYVCYGQDPYNYNESLCPNRFPCKSGPLNSVDVMRLCDGMYDCDDRSDEFVQLCASKRFYCLNGQPLSVPISQKEDGIWDCSDGSDECPPVSSRNAIFSNQKEMIANPVLWAAIWIIGLLALVGNTAVCVTTARELWKTKRSDEFVSKCTQIFIFNLSASDFLMGIYLLAVAVKSTQFSGRYCFVDASWRSGQICSLLGMLCVISSVTSALTMAMITIYRVLSVYKPFITVALEPKWVSLSCACSWFVSVFLASFPLVDFKSGYFVSKVWFPNYFYRRDYVTFNDAMTLARRMAPFNSTIHTWHDARNVIKLNLRHQPIRGVFGYYSETSVCMPSLFISHHSQSWEYSMLLITVSFLLFLLMVVGYLLIYRRGNRMADSRNVDTGAQMQKRISRLLLTDFCCWIPVCALGFVALSGVNMPSYVYALVAAVLLPINSALNPIIYSSVVDKFVLKAKRSMSRRSTSNNTARTTGF